MSAFMLGNLLFAQGKQEFTIEYKNAIVKIGDKVTEAKSNNYVTYNYQNVNGDILLDLSGTKYLFNKTSADTFTDNYSYSSYLSNNGSVVTIFRYRDNSKAIEFNIDKFAIKLF